MWLYRVLEHSFNPLGVHWRAESATFSRQNHKLVSISPLNLLHVSADLTLLVECYMDWFLWIHALLLLKLIV